MAKSQGDSFKTWTDEAMNKRIAEHDKKWREIIEPEYNKMVNEVVKFFELAPAGNKRVYIRTIQRNTVKCFGKTRFYLGTLNINDYKVVGTTYMITVYYGDDVLQHEVIEDNKEEANNTFKAMRKYYS